MLSWLPGDCNHKPENKSERVLCGSHTPDRERTKEPGFGPPFPAYNAITLQPVPVTVMDVLWVSLVALFLMAPRQGFRCPGIHPIAPESRLSFKKKSVSNPSGREDNTSDGNQASPVQKFLPEGVFVLTLPYRVCTQPPVECSVFPWLQEQILFRAAESTQRGLSGEGSIRLVNGSSSCSGAVEVHHHGQWMPVCQKMWDKEASHVVCRQLHCGEAKETAARPIPSPVCPPRSTPTKKATLSSQSLCPSLHIHCVGLESTWKQCNVSELCCGEKPASVTCTGSQSVRLVGGGSCCEGRVEVEADGVWGTVCDDAWDLDDAGVVCQQLRCGWAIQAPVASFFRKGTGPIHLDEVSCAGNESYLWDCPAERSHDCGHKEDAGVVCSEHQEWRLLGGRDACAGRVEAYYQGVWNMVCDGTWYKEEMDVLCQWLGCGPSVQKLNFNHTQEGRMSYLCSGTEASLSWCQWHYNNLNLCHQSQAAGVICNGSLGLLNTSAVPPLEMMTPDTGRTHTVSSSSLAAPVLVNHSAQGTEMPAGGANDYRKVTPKAEAEPLAVPAPGSEDSDSDYEHYDFSSKPPVALSTFYNSLRHRAADETLPASGFPPAPGQEVLNEGPEPWGQPEQRPCEELPAESSSSSEDNYYNNGTTRQQQWGNPAPPPTGSLLTPVPPAQGNSGSQLSFQEQFDSRTAKALDECGNKPVDSVTSYHSGEGQKPADPKKTTTAPPPPPTTPEPTGPPRMRLVDGRFYCSGIVELYMGGHWGTVQSNPENETELARWVCRKIGCGDALEQKDRSFLVKNERQHLPVHWEMVASCGSDSIPDCFNRTRNSQDKTPASVICSSSQPRVMRRLGDSQSPCEGVMEVFHEGKWEVLCDSNSWKKSRGQQVCQELQCGKLSLSVQVPGQNFKPRSAGVGAGTIVSILLALILLGVLIIICGPPAYKKLQKKYSKKQQRQWIGPTGLQQTVSFHRNSTVTLRPRQEGQGAQGEDNDYSQTPKKNSYLSAYPARIDISDHDTGEDDEASSPEVLTSIQAKQGLEVAEVVGQLPHGGKLLKKYLQWHFALQELLGHSLKHKTPLIPTLPPPMFSPSSSSDPMFSDMA
ncbi:T-cell differentiation antigen CD6 [Chelonia mydas]|uniref:T-cell differentiation antigen CD6 n=1 Tax=Chelonia mydas TaxID=8469 RepID=M7ANU2_CHEMY|nr:T-cell differentiation antigen CD6 [Chelonia mydas]